MNEENSTGKERLNELSAMSVDETTMQHLRNSTKLIVS
jgi:hypothetical protein